MPFTTQEIRQRHRAKQWVKEKEASYAAERYASFKADPEKYAKRLKQARESSLIRKWTGLAQNAGLSYAGISRDELALIFVTALIQLTQESADRRRAWCREHEKKRDRTNYRREYRSRIEEIKSDPEKLAIFRAKNREGRKAWYAANKDKIREGMNRKARESYAVLMTDPEAREKRRARSRAWRSTEDGKKKSAWYAWRSRKKNPSHKIGENLRRRINAALRGKRCGKEKTEALLGMTIKNFTDYVSSLWLPGMTWDNYGIGRGKWSLDHKTPCAFYDLIDPEQQKLCFHYSNIQPMWFSDNCIKSNKLPDGTRAKFKPQLTESGKNDTVTPCPK